MDLKRGIDKAVAKVVENLITQSERIESDLEKVKQVAAISANNDNEIGELIADAMKRVTKDGVITVEESKGTDTHGDEVSGMQFGRGYLSAHFVSNTDTKVASSEDPLI